MRNKNEKGILDYLKISWYITITIATIISTVVIVNQHLLPKKSKIVIDVVQVLPPAYLYQSQVVRVPIIFKIANPEERNFVITSIEAFCESRETVPIKGDPIVVYNIDKKTTEVDITDAMTFDSLAVDTASEKQLQHLVFPLLVKSGTEKLIKAHFTFDTMSYLGNEGHVFCGAFPPINQIKVLITLNGKSIILNPKDLPNSYGGSIAYLSISDEEYAKWLKPKLQKINKLLNLYKIDKIININVTSTLSCFEGPNLQMMYELKYTEDGATKNLKLYESEIDKLIKSHTSKQVEEIIRFRGVDI